MTANLSSLCPSLSPPLHPPPPPPPPPPQPGVDFSDPLEEIYVQTLRRRLLSDFMAAIFILVVISALSVSTAFCRHPVRLHKTYMYKINVRYTNLLLFHTRRLKSYKY